MPKRVVTGIVTSDKMSKTRRVEIDRRVKHPKYGKFIKKRTVCYAHDEEDASGVGDLVELIESRPLSKLKRWQLTRVIEKSTLVDVAALRAARKSAAEAEAIETAHIGDPDAVNSPAGDAAPSDATE